MSYIIGIFDDDKNYRHQLYLEIKKILEKHGINAKIKLFDTLTRLEYYQNESDEPLDLLFLDIYEGEKSKGIDYAKHLREIENPIEIILSTFSKDFAIEGYNIDSQAYLLKPSKTEDIENALLKAFNKRRKNSISFKTPSKVLQLDLDRILYIDVYDKNVFFHMANGKVESLKASLKSVYEELPKDHFAQCHRSYLVSIPAITSIKRYELTLSNQEQLPISKKYFLEIQDKLIDYVDKL